MSEPLSIAASVAGLISMTQGLYQLLIPYLDNDISYSQEFNELASEIRTLCGILSLLQPVIQRLEQSSSRYQNNSGQGRLDHFIPNR